MQHNKTLSRKMRLGIFGSKNSPSLYQALQIAYGLCGSYNRVVVLDNKGKGDRYNILGPYSTFGVHELSTPTRYAELLNIAQGCKDVIIIDDFSLEWEHGVTGQLNDFNYEDVLRSHRDLLNMIRYSCCHVIVIMKEERKLNFSTKEGKPRLSYTYRPIQQEGIERYFTSVIRSDRKGNVTSVKDLTGVLPSGRPFKIDVRLGAVLQDWCCEGKTIVPDELQRKINACNTLGELYQLLFAADVEDIEMISAFTTRRLELEAQEQAYVQDYLPF